jgi:glycosyltransferase involved in cell wall biosynthesis
VNVLFVHQGFPGQYLHICRALAQQGNHRLVAMGMQQPGSPLPKGVQYVMYGASRGNGQDVHPLALETETKVIRAEACAAAAEQLKRQGFRPDIICGHPGWGELLFLPYIWPDVPILMYQEFYYQVHGFDYDFDPEFQAELSWQKCAKAQMKNANTLLNLEAASWNVSPTNFQRSSFPERFHQRISVIHDGIDAKAAPAQANAGLTLTLRDGQVLRQGEAIITFVNRTIEPYRGCHSFIRAIPHIQALQPNARIVIVGAEQGVSYGSVCPKGEWKDRFMAEIKGSYNPAQLHFTGNLGYADFLTLLKLSQAHVYLTYPFVLSWSLLEAMSTACAIVGSTTAPVQEVIQDGHNGLLVDFFSPRDIADAVDQLLRDRKLAKELGQQARKDALAHYSLERCLPRQLELIDLVASRALGR